MTTNRNRELALIHIGASDLGLDDAAYRDVLWRVARVRSAAQLDSFGRRQVISHLRACGWRPARRKSIPTAGAPAALRSCKQLQKIGRLLAEGDLSWRYADGIVRQMYGLDTIAWCAPKQLSAVITALIKRQQRHAETG